MFTQWILGAAPTLAGSPSSAEASPTPEAAGTDVVQEIVANGGNEALASKLTSEQAYDILAMQIRPGMGGDAEEAVIAIVFFLVAALITVAILFYRYRRNGQLHETIRLMVEKGVDIPKNMFERLPLAATDLRRGIILIAGGIGFTLFLLAVTRGQDGAWSVGIVPVFVGVGFLLSAWLRREKTGGRGERAAA